MSSILTLTSPDKCDDYREDAFYPTPWDATESFMLAEKQWIDQIGNRNVDEPACGEGDMAKILELHGLNVHATDLVDRGYGKGGVDFLNLHYQRRSPRLITNPPFPLAAEFIKQAHRLGYDYIGMILKANYFNTGNRKKLFREHRPVRVRPYSWRIDFTGDGRNHFDCIYVAWMPQASDGRCEFCEALERPKVLQQKGLFDG